MINCALYCRYWLNRSRGNLSNVQPTWTWALSCYKLLLKYRLWKSDLLSPWCHVIQYFHQYKNVFKSRIWRNSLNAKTMLSNFFSISSDIVDDSDSHFQSVMWVYMLISRSRALWPRRRSSCGRHGRQFLFFLGGRGRCAERGCRCQWGRQQCRQIRQIPFLARIPQAKTGRRHVSDIALLFTLFQKPLQLSVTVFFRL